MKGTWRFIDTGAGDPFLNMSIDEAILDSYVRFGGSPVLRVYRWSRPSLSIGAGQSARDIDREQCRLRGIDFVRRPTGGRAVLHDEEVTYSVVASSRDGFPDSIRATYDMISLALIAAYRSLGVEVAVGPKRRAGGNLKACFLLTAAPDLGYRGRKVSGSAQTRRGRAFLQHGSIVIRYDVDLLFSLLSYPTEGERKREKRAFIGSAASLEGITGKKINGAEIISALRKGIRETWRIDFRRSELSPEEGELARVLLRAKYRSASWNYKR